MHENTTSAQQSGVREVVRGLAAAGVVGVSGLATVLESEARRRRHRHNRDHDHDDRKDHRGENRDDRDNRDDRNDDKPKQDASAKSTDADDDGGNNHVPERTSAAAPVPSVDANDRTQGAHDRSDQITFVS